MKYIETQNKKNTNILEHDFVSVNHILNEEQKQKLIQDKFERARKMHEAQKASPIYED